MQFLHPHMLNQRHTLFILGIWLLGSLNAQNRFFVTISGGNLYSVDPQNCIAEFIGSTGQGFGDIALSPNGTLWGYVSSQIYQIDTIDATATWIGNTGIPAVSLVALNDSILFINSGNDLYGISTLDASSWLIGNIGYQSLGDLAWFGEDLYMSVGGRLIRIELSNDHLSIVSVSSVNDVDPDLPVSEGLATGYLDEDKSAFISIRPNGMYCISPIDASYQYLCPNPLPGGVPGAASFKPQPTPWVGCSIVHPSNIHEENITLPEVRMAGNNLIASLTNAFDRWVITDALGRFVANGSLNRFNDEVIIPLSNYAAGHYLISFSGPSFVHSIRFYRM